MVICEIGCVSSDEHVPHPVEDESLIILGETDIGDEASIHRKRMKAFYDAFKIDETDIGGKAYGSVGRIHRKLLLKAFADYHDLRLGVTKGEPRMTFDISKFEDPGWSKLKETPEFGGDRIPLATEHKEPPEPKHPWEEVEYPPFGRINSYPPPGAFYLEALEATAANKMGGFPGYKYLPGLPDIGTGRILLATEHKEPPEPKRPWEEVQYPPFGRINSYPPPGAFYPEVQEATAADKVGGFHGYEYLPGPPDIGTGGNSAGTLGMQGGLMIVMFAVCYMLYMILKKRVCSFHIGWKDNDGGAELELGGPREA